MSNLKQTLIDYDLCIDNEYLDLYVKLIEANLKTKKTVNCTQAHHIIPVSYYYKFLPEFERYVNNGKYMAALKFANQDSANRKINLLYADHILAHCYLALCGKSNAFIWGNANCIHRIAPNIDVNTFISETDKKAFQEAYELSRQQVRNSPASFTRENNPNTGKVYIHNSDGWLLIDPSEMASYLEKGWELGKCESIHKNIGKQCCRVHKDGEYRQIAKNNLAKYLADGWIYGAAGMSRKKNNR